MSSFENKGFASQVYIVQHLLAHKWKGYPPWTSCPPGKLELPALPEANHLTFKVLGRVPIKVSDRLRNCAKNRPSWWNACEMPVKCLCFYMFFAWISICCAAKKTWSPSPASSSRFPVGSGAWARDAVQRSIPFGEHVRAKENHGAIMEQMMCKSLNKGCAKLGKIIMKHPTNLSRSADLLIPGL